MRITVLKGTDEIGGSCVEISTERTRILVDYGAPLNGGAPVDVSTDGLDAILISHPHQDHYGGIFSLDAPVLIYTSEVAGELMQSTRIFNGKPKIPAGIKYFKQWKPFIIGDFTITPFLVDHSAPDACAFLIESGGQKILYGGDFRSGGRKGKLFEMMLNDARLKGLDAVLMEGTMLHRSNEFPNEDSVEKAMKAVLEPRRDIAFLISSSQNIDTIVSAYRASHNTERTFVVDMYTAWILEVVRRISKRTPDMSWDDVAVLKTFGKRHYQTLKDHPDHFGSFVNTVFRHAVTVDDIAAAPGRFFVKVSPVIIEKVIDAIGADEADIVYSQWKGYLDERYSGYAGIFGKLKNTYRWHYAHTSGHADIDALRRFSDALSPRALIPIHTEHKDQYTKHFNNVVVLNDNEPYQIQH